MNKLLLLSFCVLFNLSAKKAYAQPGFSCDNPIQISSLPYFTSEDTSNYSDNLAIEGTPGASGCGTTGAYLDGNDVVYSFTAVASGTVSVILNTTEIQTGIFAYASCADIGINCIGGQSASTEGTSNFTIQVTAGQTYYLVISTFALPQTTIYTLNVEEITCQAPTTLSATNISSQSAQLSWSNPSNSATFEVAVLPFGSPTPTTTVTGTSSNSNYAVNGLSADTQYQFYVRSNCGNIGMSSWVGPFAFVTLSNPPTCGGSFFDTGGLNGNYNSNENKITTICPNSQNEKVTVAFTSFATEASFDGLYVFNGNSIMATQIPSTNAAGSVPGGLAGAYWGTTIPGPFTSTSSDGCLTFKFVSDSVITKTGWTASVSCSQYNCNTPTNVTKTNATESSITLSWNDSNNSNQWEVYAVPFGTTAPAPGISGQVVTTNPFTITGLLSATRYSFYVKSVCPNAGNSLWSIVLNANTLIANDESSNAIDVQVNNGVNCQLVSSGALVGATASVAPIITAPYTGVADDDVWFKFVANNTTQNITLQYVTGSNCSLKFAVYSGTFDNLTQVNYNSSASVPTFAAGTTYFIRVYSNESTPQTTFFNVCVSVRPTVSNARSVCGVNNYPNTTNVASQGTIGCLFSSPNPTYFSMKIAASGPVNLQFFQSSLGSAAPNLDVDYAAWGPFASFNEGVIAVNGGQTPGIGTGAATLVTGCSFSAASTETLNIPNAIAGQYYILLVTNFSNQVGFISISQVNENQEGAGSIDCTGINLNAFIDTNSNGIKDPNEINFTLGQFEYTVNNDAAHHIVAPTGIYHIYDEITSNNYNLNYTISPEYAAYYSVSAAYTNVNVASGGMTTYDFPVTILQNYNDVGVSIMPMNAPRAGATYKNKIIFTNNGNQAIPAGTLTFNCQAGTTIASVSEVGTTAIPNGFSYDFANLLPFESRNITVIMNVPAIPAVYINQLLTNTVSVTAPTDDSVVTNNNSSCTQAVVAAYDPNDKMESHGEKIMFSTYNPNDYLQYTIRFENTGNAGALDVSIIDQLDAKLDANSIKMVGASHAYTLDRVDNQLTWHFTNIQLPVSIPNTDTGKGFVTFKVKVKPGYAIGDVIPNAASIYFDSNPAIVTNTFNTEFVSALLGTPQFDENHLQLYPNPASSTVHINLQDSAELLSTIHVYDLLGKAVLSVPCSTNEQTIDVSPLLKGIYMVEITTQSQMKWVKKFVVK